MKGLNVSINNNTIVKPLNISQAGFSFLNHDTDNKIIFNIGENIIIKFLYPDFQINEKFSCNIIWNILDSYGVEFTNINDLHKEILKKIINLSLEH